MPHLLPRTAFALVMTTATLAGYAQSREIVAQVGTAVVYNQDGLGLSLGVGYEHPLSEKWSVRAAADYAEGNYEVSPGERIFDALGPDASTTQSFGFNAMLLRGWDIGARQRHRADLGLGLQARWLRVYSITEAFYTYGDIRLSERFTQPVTATQSATWQDKVGPAVRASYRYRVSDRVSLGAYWRYEPNLMDELEVYQTLYGEAEDGVGFQINNGFLEHLDVQNAMSFGVTVAYAFR